MSLFDTLTLEPAVECKKCGKQHDHVQSHLLGDCMSTWRVGSLIKHCPVHTGVFKEEITCCQIPETEHGYHLINVWIIIWHGIYAGHTLDERSALEKMNSIDRLDLLSWLDNAQTELRTWRGRFRSLTRDLKDFIAYSNLPDEQRSTKSKSKQKFFILLPEEIRNDADPLSRILERNAEDHPPSGIWLDE